MAQVTVDRLEKSYGAHRILRGVSFTIESGKFISLLGPSGSGKTTILRCLAGLEAPDPTSGEIRVGESVFSGPGGFVRAEERQLGMVFQNYAVWPHMTVAQNVAFPLEIRRGAERVTPAEIARRVGEALRRVRLDHLADRYAHQLSGGQQQRIALARALVTEPGILLLDEPLSNLDALLREELGSEIRRLQLELGLTTVLVTHDQKEALSLSDWIIVLKGGEIEAQGRPEDLYTRPPTDFVAQFLSGAQILKDGRGQTATYLPRRWRVLQAAPNAGPGSFRVLTRIYLGNEYEYWARSDDYAEPVRFYSGTAFEPGASVGLAYGP